MTMNTQDRGPYTSAERRAIILEARRVAAELLERIETLAHMDGVNDEAMEAAKRIKRRIEGGTRDGGEPSG